jgi:hypothetical protein
VAQFFDACKNLLQVIFRDFFKLFPNRIGFLEKMGVQQVIDSIFNPHGNWSRLSYGQLTVLFVTYVLHSPTHRFSGMEAWVNQHKAVIERVTGWRVGEKDATDDRLGKLGEVLGESEEGISECQLRIAKSEESISALVPGNPKMKTTRPTAERLLSQFDNLHLLIEDKGKKGSTLLVEGLTILQKKILSILQLPEEIYDFSFKQGKSNSAF